MSSCYQKHRRWRCPGRAVVFSFLLNYSNLQKGRLQLECKVVVVYLFFYLKSFFYLFLTFSVVWRIHSLLDINHPKKKKKSFNTCSIMTCSN